MISEGGEVGANCTLIKYPHKLHGISKYRSVSKSKKNLLLLLTLVVPLTSKYVKKTFERSRRRMKLSVRRIFSPEANYCLQSDVKGQLNGRVSDNGL
jgi:hypothetical protein